MCGRERETERDPVRESKIKRGGERQKNREREGEGEKESVCVLVPANMRAK